MNKYCLLRAYYLIEMLYVSCGLYIMLSEMQSLLKRCKNLENIHFKEESVNDNILVVICRILLTFIRLSMMNGTPKYGSNFNESVHI